MNKNVLTTPQAGESQGQGRDLQQRYPRAAEEGKPKASPKPAPKPRPSKRATTPKLEESLELRQVDPRDHLGHTKSSTSKGPYGESSPS